MALPDQHKLAALLRYCPETGRLFWRGRSQLMFKTKRAWSIWNTRYAGKEAFTSTDSEGYRSGSIYNKTYRAHRIIWKLIHGFDPTHIDHVDGKRQNNRISNLRSASKRENQRNQKLRSDNTSGHVGVYSHPSGKWEVRVGSEYLGLFDSFEIACRVQENRQHELGFHENHGDRR